MRKAVIILMFSLLVSPCLVFGQESQQIEIAPLVKSSEGSGGALSFIETRWPDFYEYIPAGNACGITLKAVFSKKRKVVAGVPAALEPDANGDGIFDYVTDAIDPASGKLQSYFNAPAPSDQEVVYEYTPTDADYQSTDLVVTADFSTDWAEYRDSARILVTWTVRLEGEKRIVNPNRGHKPYYTSGCRGTSKQAFNQGNAYTKFFLKAGEGEWKAMGNPAVMTVPYGGEGVASGIVDPTHTGSLVLTPDDFGGSFPEQINFTVRVYNDTCMLLGSPEGKRNLVVTITPIN